MGLTQWSSEYSLGIDEIDGQHKVLINCIAALESSIDDPDEKQRWAAIHYAIVKLSDYTRIHFTVEESLMRMLSFPDVESHVAEHQALRDQLEKFRKRAQDFEVADDLAAFIQQWLNDHVDRFDREFVDYFLRAGIDPDADPPPQD